MKKCWGRYCCALRWPKLSRVEECRVDGQHEDLFAYDGQYEDRGCTCSIKYHDPRAVFKNNNSL